MAGPRTIKGRAREVVARLAEAYPGSAQELCALRHENPFQLLVATILSAQCTDARVNMVTPTVFAAYPDPASLAAADPQRLEDLIHSTGFFRSKAKSLLGMSSALVERYGGEVPSAMEDLVTLPGVGRKTANVVRSVAFGLPGLPVDTHVGRITRLLGLTSELDPVAVERDLDALVPPAERGAFSLRLILHGRAVCVARSPHCADCLLSDICPSARLPIAPAGRRGICGRWCPETTYPQELVPWDCNSVAAKLSLHLGLQCCQAGPGPTRGRCMVSLAL
jgi:endonuclease-3